MSAETSLPEPGPSMGMYALQVATIYAFGAFALLAGVAILLQYLSLVVSLSWGESLAQASSGVMVDSHACLLGFLVLGTVRWNFGGMASLRHARDQRSEHHAVPVKLPRHPPREVGRTCEVKLNPYFPDNWRRTPFGTRAASSFSLRG